MRPKTRFQYEVVAANEKLLQLTEAPIEWAYQKTINHYAYRTASGKTTCMDCGHQWNTEHHNKYDTDKHNNKQEAGSASLM